MSADEPFADGTPPLSSGRPKPLSALKAVYVANVFDAHNTVFAKLPGLEVLDAEGVFCGSFSPSLALLFREF
jgi:hypothetical protein